MPHVVSRRLHDVRLHQQHRHRLRPQDSRAGSYRTDPKKPTYFYGEAPRHAHRRDPVGLLRDSRGPGLRLRDGLGPGWKAESSITADTSASGGTLLPVISGFRGPIIRGWRGRGAGLPVLEIRVSAVTPVLAPQQLHLQSQRPSGRERTPRLPVHHTQAGTYETAHPEAPHAGSYGGHDVDSIVRVLGPENNEQLISTPSRSSPPPTCATSTTKSPGCGPTGAGRLANNNSSTTATAS
jgi:hypothetical protein